jgi:hypothetical protein
MSVMTLTWPGSVIRIDSEEFSSFTSSLRVPGFTEVGPAVPVWPAVAAGAGAAADAVAAERRGPGFLP